MILFPAFAHAATLSCPAVTTAGEEFVIPLLLQSSGKEQVAGLQFDLALDSSVFALRGVDTGSATTTAGKLVSSNAMGSGKLRIIIAGLNQTAIPNGELIRLRLVPQSGADSGVYELKLSGVVLSDPAGKRLNADLSLGEISLGEGSAPTQPTTRPKGCGCAPGAGEEGNPLADAGVVIVTLLVLLLAGRRGGEANTTRVTFPRRP